MTLRKASLVVALALASLALGCGSAAAARTVAMNAIPFGFELPATNGWRARALGLMNPKTAEGLVILAFARPGEGVSYRTQDVTFTETTMTARFGPLGEIDVHSVPTGGTSTESSACGGRSVEYPSGRWEGTISFEGEEGFTSLDASSAEAEIALTLDLVCGESVDEGLGGHLPGALLTLKRRHGHETFELTARKNKRHGPSRFVAHIEESRGKVFIGRTISAVGPNAAFNFEIPPGIATIEPPAPFSGSLDFGHRKGASPSVKGNLTVDFPGRANVPVFGPGRLHASLERAVLNPSHPF